MHFCQLGKQQEDRVLTLYGSPILVVQEYKYLGLIFDKKNLSFIPHINYIKANSPRARNRFNQVVEAKRFEGGFLCRKVC